MLDNENTLYEKKELLNIIDGSEFKNLFLKNNITNVILFGSITTDLFTCESDVDIAIISKEKISFKEELKLTQQLESLLKREVDLIDINDKNVNNLIKISALNSKFIILKDELLEDAINLYDNLCRENQEFWSILDKVVLNIE